MEEKIGVMISIESGVAVVGFHATSISNSDGIACASAQIEKFVAENNPKVIVFDFEPVKFFSSQVLGVLLNIRSKLKAYNGEVVISGINPQLHRVFKITNLDKIFRFFADKQQAIAAFTGN